MQGNPKNPKPLKSKILGSPNNFVFKWKKIIYFTIITTKNNSEWKQMKAKQDSDTCRTTDRSWLSYCVSGGAQDGGADRNFTFSTSTPNNSELAVPGHLHLPVKVINFICPAPLTSCPLSLQYIFWLSLQNLNLNKLQPD